MAAAGDVLAQEAADHDELDGDELQMLAASGFSVSAPADPRAPAALSPRGGYGSSPGLTFTKVNGDPSPMGSRPSGGDDPEDQDNLGGGSGGGRRNSSMVSAADWLKEAEGAAERNDLAPSPTPEPPAYVTPREVTLMNQAPFERSPSFTRR